MAQPKRLFLREASGLVREVTPFKALFFNFAAMSGGIVLANYVYNAFYPAAPTFGMASLTLAQILIAIPLILVALIFVGMLQAIPRTGGDYVFTSRIISPYLGWVETWTLAFTNLAIIGFELLQINLTTSGFATAMGIIYSNNSFWPGVSSFLSSTTGQASIGIILILLMGAMSLLSTRRFHTVVTTLAILGVSGLIIQIVGVPLMSFSQFSSNFQLYTGNTTSQVLNTASSLPAAPMSLSPLTFSLFAGAIGFALFNLIGFQYSAYIGGELKGGVRKNGLISTLGSLWLYTILVWIVLVPVIFGIFGYSFLHAWAYLYFNAPSIAPLGGAYPSSAVIGTVTAPGTWPLWLFVVIVGDGLMFALGPVYLFATSRMVFAWAWDRLIPKWFAEVNDRTHTPIRIYILLLIGGLIFFLMSLPPIGLNLNSLAYYSILLSALTWILPGFNALLMPFRRKDIFESSGFKKKIAGLPIIAWLGLIWVVIIVPIYLVAFLQPLISGAFSTPTWAYADSSGIVAFVVIFIVGTILYFAGKSYQRSRGIDIDLIFKSIPPE